MTLPQLIYRLATDPEFRESLQPTSEIFAEATSALTLPERQALEAALQQGDQWYQLLTRCLGPSDEGWVMPITASHYRTSHAA